MDFRRQGRISRLVKALPHNFSALRSVRELRAELLRDDAGCRYPGNTGQIYGEVINLIQEARTALALSMSAYSPRFSARTFNASLRGHALKMGRALNHWSPRIRLQQTLQSIAAEGFFSLGIGKSYRADAPPLRLENDVYIDPGMPFFAPRTVNHMSWDGGATDFRYCSYIADRYRACQYKLQEDKRINPAIRNQLYQEGGEGRSSEALAERIATDSYWVNDDTQVEPWIWLSDCYVPSEKVIHTFVVDDTFKPKFDDPIFSIEWDGRPEGPFHFLNLGPVPDQTIPSSPAQNVSTLHNFVNTLLRKLQDQAERAKQVSVSATADEEDAERMRTAEDGDHVGLNNPDTVNKVSLDGPDQSLFVLMIQTMKLFDRAGGNVEYRLGMGANADTLGQQQMIGQQVSRLEGFHQLNWVDFVRQVGVEQGRMLFSDAATRIPMSVQIPHTDIQYQDDWQGAYEEGARGIDPTLQERHALGQLSDQEFWQKAYDSYEIEVDPESMAYKSSGQRLGEIRAVVQELMPLEPLFNQRGKAFNVDKYLSTISRYGDLPEVEELWEDAPRTPTDQTGAPPQQLLAGAGAGGHYVHENVSRGGGDDMAGLVSMMGASQE